MSNTNSEPDEQAQAQAQAQAQSSALRKHLYLITEHEESGLVGRVVILDHRHSRGVKNEEMPVQTFDEEEGTFGIVGKQVPLGYVDFADEDELHGRLSEEIKRKLGEIDRAYLEKAGVAEAVSDE